MGEMICTNMSPRKIAAEIHARTAKMSFDVLNGCYILEDYEGNRMILEPEIYLMVREILERG